MSGWPDPLKPGMPLNPERDGWHWLLQPVTEKQWIIAWNPDWNYWGAFPGISPNDMGHPKLRGYKYLGPVLTPAEADALRAENARLREALAFYVRIRAQPVELVKDFGNTAEAALKVKP
jgi:hypothetical protein